MDMTSLGWALALTGYALLLAGVIVFIVKWMNR